MLTPKSMLICLLGSGMQFQGVNLDLYPPLACSGSTATDPDMFEMTQQNCFKNKYFKEEGQDKGIGLRNTNYYV